MIALITFDKILILPREEAKELGIDFSELTYRLGWQNGIVEQLSYSGYAIKNDDAFPVEEEGKLVWKRGDEVISQGYIYEPLPDRLKDIDFVQVEQSNHMVDLLQFATKCSYPYRIVKSINNTGSPDNIHSVLYALEEKTTKLQQVVASLDLTFNEKCNVHIGGGLLVTFNDFMLQEDCCTDTLQEKVNNGWRIVACCVQADQRRPDYVLGRYNADNDHSWDKARRN